MCFVACLSLSIMIDDHYRKVSLTHHHTGSCHERLCMAVLHKNALELYAEVSETSPQKIAVELNDQTWSYAELLANTLRVAHHLRIHEDDIVYQFIDSPFEVICGLMSTLCAGGTYVPLSPSILPMQIRPFIDEVHDQYILLHGKTREGLSAGTDEHLTIIHLDSIITHNMAEDLDEMSTYQLISIPNPNFHSF